MQSHADCRTSKWKGSQPNSLAFLSPCVRCFSMDGGSLKPPQNFLGGSKRIASDGSPKKISFHSRGMRPSIELPSTSKAQKMQEGHAPAMEMANDSATKAHKISVKAAEIEAQSAPVLAAALDEHRKNITGVIGENIQSLRRKSQELLPELTGIEVFDSLLKETTGALCIEVAEAGASLQEAGREVSRSQLRTQSKGLEQKLERNRIAATVNLTNTLNHMESEHARQLDEAKALMAIGDARQAKATIDGLRSQLEASEAREDGMQKQLAQALDNVKYSELEKRQAKREHEREVAEGAEAILELARLEERHSEEKAAVHAEMTRVADALAEAASEAERASVSKDAACKEMVAKLAKRLREEELASKSGRREASSEQMQRLLDEMMGLTRSREQLDSELSRLVSEGEEREAASSMQEVRDEWIERELQARSRTPPFRCWLHTLLVVLRPHSTPNAIAPPSPLPAAGSVRSSPEDLSAPPPPRPLLGGRARAAQGRRRCKSSARRGAPDARHSDRGQPHALRVHGAGASGASARTRAAAAVAAAVTAAAVRRVLDHTTRSACLIRPCACVRCANVACTRSCSSHSARSVRS